MDIRVDGYRSTNEDWLTAIASRLTSCPQLQMRKSRWRRNWESPLKNTCEAGTPAIYQGKSLKGVQKWLGHSLRDG